MANQVTDNRTDIADGTSATGWEDIAGAALAVDTEITYDTYSGSIGQYATTTADATLYNNGSTGLFASGDVAYLLINCGVVSLLHTKALRGLAVRVTGATATDWKEFELFGRDEWPVTFNGGWAQIVVDIDDLLTNFTNQNGSPPTVTNIQRFGIVFETNTVMPRMTDNIWVGGFRILGSATPAIIVEGRNGGSTDWDFASIAAVAAVQLSAVIKPGTGGSFVCRGPIQFGINDTSTHAFTETNKTLLWDDQEVLVDGFYGLSALGNSGGTTNVTFGVKTGTGDDATGTQGGAIQAAATRARWAMDFNDANVDGVNFYGASFVHGGAFLLDDPAVSVISSLYIDCTSALVSNSEQLRISVVDANTADDVAFMTTDDLTDIVFSSFNFSDGHAVELTTPRVASQSDKGNIYIGYGADGTTDAAIYNNTAGAVTKGNSDGTTGDTVKDGTSATTTVQNFVEVGTSGVSEGTAVKIIADETVGTITKGDVIFTGFADSTGEAKTTQFNYEGAFGAGLNVKSTARNQGIAVAAIADDGGALTDETTEASSETASDMNLLPATPVANDRYYFGAAMEFDGLKLDITSSYGFDNATTQEADNLKTQEGDNLQFFGGTGGTAVITWEYWNGAWVSLSGVVDGTDNFTRLLFNKVSWTAPGDWATTTVNSQGPLYYVRATLSTLGNADQVLAKKCQLNTTRYLPYDADRVIVPSIGLSDIASWTVDSISTF